ncbi:MAG: methyl-accepting chemotaxis protein [Actinomycetia bacterium]|nr:methyl-accepting chemotaxis protein [Actinomycetes bacterium]
MLTLKTRLICGLSAVALLLGAQVMVTSSMTSNSVEQLEQLEQDQNSSIESALLGNRIKLNVVQVQQWLTDISATRAMDGLNDGIDVAAEHAADFQLAVEELQTLRPELAQDLANLRSVFSTYHATGVRMAHAYIEEGPAGGNLMMAEFDEAAAAMGETVDILVDELLAETGSSLDAARSNARRIGTISLMASLAIAALIAGTGAVILISILRRLKTFTAAASEIASGDLTIETLPADQNDTLGQLATSFNEMATMLSSVGHQAELIAAGDLNTEHEIPGELGQSFDSMIGSLSTMVNQLKNSSGRLSSAADQLTDVASKVGESAEKTAGEASSASMAGDDVSERVATVASSIEEMNNKILEVAASASTAASVASEAVEVAEHTSKTITKLGESSEEIGTVIMVIDSIAAKTNLLALNATTEAARAGEAGKESPLWLVK